MKIKNTGPKVLGFGIIQVLPGEIKDLPDNIFGPNHPTVKYLLKRGWLTCVSGAGGILLPSDADVSEGIEDPPVDEDHDPIDVITLTPSAVARMNVPTLQDLARQLEIEFIDNAKKSDLILLISAVLFPGSDEDPNEEQE